MFLLLASWPFMAEAAEGDCHLKHCFVPAPTVYTPEMGQITAARPAITGLTWKTTVVKVYLDGNELTDVQQIKHEDYFGSFYASIPYNLSPGRHYVYTIAHSEKPGWGDQSKESTYVYFTVPQPPAKPLSAPEQDLSADKDQNEKDEPIKVNIIESGQSVDVKLGASESSIGVEAGKIEGGVSVEAEIAPESSGIVEKETVNETEENFLQDAVTFNELGDTLEGEFKERKLAETMKRNRVIGLSFLGLLVIVILIWLSIANGNIKKEFKKEASGDLPPAPQPPQDKNSVSKSKDEEIKVEPLKPEPEENEQSALDLLDEEELDYWAAPVSSPYSAYPPTEDDEDKNNISKSN